MLAICLTLGMALALTRRRPGAYSQGEGLAKAGAFVRDGDRINPVRDATAAESN